MVTELARPQAEARRCCWRERRPAAAVAGGFPVLFGFGRFIHDTLPIAALCTFMVWMALSSDGLRRWRRCVAFGIAGWTMLRSGESFYGSVLGMLVILGPVLIEVGHALRANRA